MMLKPRRKRKEMGIPARSKDPLARQCSFGEMSFQRGSELRARISAQALAQAPAYPEVPAGPFLGLQLTGFSVYWSGFAGGLNPSHLPAGKGSRLPGSLRITGALHTQ